MAFLVAQTVENVFAMEEIQIQSLGLEGPLEKGMATHSIFLPQKSHGWTLVGYRSTYGTLGGFLNKEM